MAQNGSADYQTFNGFIDDVRIYNRALSATEVMQLYNLGAATKVDTSSKVTLKTGLVGYWTFDGKDTSWKAGTTNDLSGNNNTGHLISMSTTTSPVVGKIGQALKFNGASGYVNVNSTAGDMTTNSFSLAFWVKGAINSSSSGRLVNKRTGSLGYEVYFPTNGGYPFGYIGTTTPCAGSCDFGGFSDKVILDKKWHYVVAIFNRTTNKINGYIDGALQNTSVDISAMLSASISNSTNLTIGDASGGGNYYFNGSLNDVRVYNRALTSAEITQLYNLGAGTHIASSPTVATTTCSNGLSCGLVGYWTMDGKDTKWTSAYAGTITDKSGKGNTGTLTNMGRATSTVEGKIGQALKFDGVSNYVNVNDADSLSAWSGGAMTICSWLKITSKQTTTEVMVGKGTSNNYEYAQYVWTDNSIHFIMWQSSGSNYLTLSGSSMKLNQWNYACDVYNISATNKGVGYLNGIQVAATSTNVAGTLTNGTSPLNIGRRPDNAAGSYFNGFLDDVRIYNRALSATEITQLYDMGK